MFKRKNKFIVIFMALLFACLSVLFISFSGGLSLHRALSVHAAENEILSNEDYYRLLYLNEIERNNDVIYDFQKSGYSAEGIGYIEDGLDLSKGLNLSYLALSLVASRLTNADNFNVFSKASAIISVIKAINQAVSIYEVNTNTAIMFNQLAAELEDVYLALSNDIENQTNILIDELTIKTNYLADTMKKLDYANTLREFNSTGFGIDGGYYNWKQNLLQRYDSLIYYKNSEATAAEIKEAYDYLYITAKKSAILRSYMTSNEFVGDYSVQDILYSYYLLRWQTEQKLSMDEAVYSCLTFTEDLYNMYLFSESCLAMCYQYQLECIGTQLLPGDNINTKSYELTSTINSENRSISYRGEIYPHASDPQRYSEALSIEISKYLSKILNLGETYYYKYNDVVQKVIYREITTSETHKSTAVTTEVGKISNQHISVNREVLKGEELYMNAIPSVFIQTLGVSYNFKVDDTSKAAVTSDGVVRVIGSSGEFTVSLVCNESIIWSMHFIIVGRSEIPFSGGGLGTKETPFILLNADDLKKVIGDNKYWESKYYFKLGSDIDLKQKDIGQIGTDSKPYSGTFDGNGYAIKNGKTNALFGHNSGTIRNLTIEGASITLGYQVYACCYAGGIVNVNTGSIENCRFINSSVNVTNTANIEIGNGQFYANMLLFVGGICGNNTGNISNCITQNSEVSGSESNGIASGGGAPSKDGGYVGGIVGSSDKGTIVNCLSANNSIYLYIKSNSYYLKIWYLFQDRFDLCTAYFYEGGLAGSISDSTIENCVSYSNKVSSKWEYSTAQASGNTSKKYDQAKVENIYASIGYFSNTTVRNLYCDVSSLNSTLISSISSSNLEKMKSNGWKWSSKPVQNFVPKSLSVARMPIKTVYNQNESFNPTGLVLVTDTGKYVTDNITITGFNSSKIGIVTVNASWNGLNIPFKVKIICPHDSINEETVNTVITCNLLATTVRYCCESCGEVITNVKYVEEVEESRAVHTYDNDCDTDCNVCGATRIIDHSWDFGEIILQPTCTATGERLYTCTVCGETRIELIPKTNHIYSITVISPTCTSRGYTLHSCTLCGDSFVDDYVDMIDHNYFEINIAATCVEQGYSLHTCISCGIEWKDNYIAALGHDIESHDAQAPTCTQSGWNKYDICKRCDYNTYSEISVTGHSKEIITGKAPTCTETGLSEGEKCSVCGEILKVQQEIPAKGHTSSDWVIDNVASEGVTGHRHKECTECGEILEDEDIDALPDSAVGCGGGTGCGSTTFDGGIYGGIGLLLLISVILLSNRKRLYNTK